MDNYNRNNPRENINSDKYPTRNNIIFGQYKKIDGSYTARWRCPYDAQENAPEGFGSVGNHRMHTLGHDPILGWIFGTANLMTCTISLSKKFNFNTYRVVYPGQCFGSLCPMNIMFYEVYESIKEDKYRLPAAFVAQYFHLKSDVNTPNGLPIPILEALTEELAGKLYTEQYDSLCLLRDLKKVGTQAIFSILINMIIGFLHRIQYNENKDGKDKRLYEVRTRKILLISNLLASGGNALYCTFSNDWKKLDIGGILVSLYRLFTDIRFITRIKEEYIQKEIDKSIQKELEELNSNFI